MPILNAGMENGNISPLSRPIVAASAVNGSSSKILRGRETKTYWLACIVGYLSMPRDINNAVSGQKRGDSGGAVRR